MNRLFFGLTAWGLLLVAAGGGATLKPATNWPPRQALFETLWNSGRLVVVYPADSAQGAARYRAWATRFAARQSYLTLEFVPDNEAGDSLFLQSPVWLIGTPASNRLIAQLQGKLPLQWGKRQLQLFGKAYDDTSDVFSLSVYPNPLNPVMPLSLLCAGRDEAVLELLESRRIRPGAWGSWGYEVFRQGRRLLMGDFDDSPEAGWQPDSQARYDLSAAPLLLWETEYLRAQAIGFAPTAQQQQAILAQSARVYRQIDSLLGPARFPSGKLTLLLYPTAEQMALGTEHAAQAHLDRAAATVYATSDPAWAGAWESAENEWWILQRLDTARVVALQRGLALYFSENWQRLGWRHWARRLHDSGNLPALAAMLDNAEFRQESPLVGGAAAAALAGFLIETRGWAQFRKYYADWQPAPAEVNALDAAWRAWIAKQAQAKPTKPPEISAYLKGFNFTHEGYQIYNGYISQRASRSIGYMQGIGSNALAVVPYSYMRDPASPAYLPFAKAAGEENDASVAHVLYEARQRGMTTLLKPQVWLRGAWPGAVNMNSEQDWDAFFGHYYRWIRHYAMLAEIHGADMLCVGVEFQHASLNKPEKWRQIIQKLRGLYSGKLCYAANWGAEFEQLSFWNELDYIGLNCYYPLSDKESPSREELMAAFEAVLSKAEQVSRRNNKPLLFTEIGFRSIQAPWKAPHAEAGAAPYDPQAQALCYEVVFDCLKNKGWQKGIFWWQWSCNLPDVQPADRRYVPYTKAAEAVVRKAFGEM